MDAQSIISTSGDWFADWFNTPYYHILYKERDEAEAELFMKNLTDYLNLPEEAVVLDLACGKGRHAVYLNQLGYKVVGADLSEENIGYAKQFESPSLQFIQHDMRCALEDKYDAVFNLFTSFGYFENEADNTKTLQAIHQSLKDDGFAVMDFFNADYVIENLVPEEEKTVDGITFHINRYLKEGFIVKEIRFEDQGVPYFFTEKVRALSLTDFEKIMEENDIYLLDIFGDYRLNKFHKKTSERLIMIFK